MSGNHIISQFPDLDKIKSLVDLSNFNEEQIIEPAPPGYYPNITVSSSPKNIDTTKIFELAFLLHEYFYSNKLNNTRPQYTQQDVHISMLSGLILGLNICDQIILERNARTKAYQQNLADSFRVLTDTPQIQEESNNTPQIQEDSNNTPQIPEESNNINQSTSNQIGCNKQNKHSNRHERKRQNKQQRYQNQQQQKQQNRRYRYS